MSFFFFLAFGPLALVTLSCAEKFYLGDLRKVDEEGSHKELEKKLRFEESVSK